MQIGKIWKFVGGGVAAGAIVFTSVACSGTTTTTTQIVTTTQLAATQTTAKNLILSSDMVTGSGGTVKAASSCVLDNVYHLGNQVVFRIRVYDPVTGKPMDDKTLSNVTISLPDGQSFKAKYAAHGKVPPIDSFWATSWVIPADYPTGSLTYTATATATDGRTGTFDNFNVAPSLLTVVE